MTSNASDDRGPDLTQGVTLADFGGRPLLRGHVGDDAVVLARVGDEVMAVGASCTHYGGPLDKGLVVGDTLRCPWHHACFSLRSGEAVGAPAFDPLPCWQVEREESASRCPGRSRPRRSRCARRWPSRPSGS
ncbi:MAG TPA: Rieske 2Fe-2S domain-containing protein [Paracoccus sp. (in: a-proteobacteria)]|nr:Rieske 2Fe-2S domain-containing protein [Paracoccus sp. (in: a-proteobacteria)]